MPAPSLSASGVMTSSNVAASFNPRPPETITLALVSSGRSLLALSEPTKLDSPASPVPETPSTVPDQPSDAAVAKGVPRTVITSFASLDSTVAFAVQAYIGRG